jgi:hypothetical protein
MTRGNRDRPRAPYQPYGAVTLSRKADEISASSDGKQHRTRELAVEIPRELVLNAGIAADDGGPPTHLAVICAAARSFCQSADCQSADNLVRGVSCADAAPPARRGALRSYQPPIVGGVTNVMPPPMSGSSRPLSCVSWRRLPNYDFIALILGGGNHASD